MNAWLYTQGSWSEIVDRIDFEQLEKQGLDWEESIKQSGYRTMGSPDETGLNPFFFYELYEGHSGYLVLVFFGNHGGPNIYIDDFPSLMWWLKEFGSLAASSYISAWLGYKGDEIHGIVEKQFRATHGHSPDNSCWECDPDGMKRREIRKRERENTKNNAQ